MRCGQEAPRPSRPGQGRGALGRQARWESGTGAGHGHGIARQRGRRPAWPRRGRGRRLAPALVALVLLISLTALPTAAAAGIELTTLRPAYGPGATVLVQGSTGAGAANTVALQVQDPAGDVIFVDQVPVGTSGSFADSLTLLPTAVPGTYVVRATAGSGGVLEGQVSFIVTATAATLTLAPSAAVYAPGSPVTLSGTLTPASAANVIQLSVTGPSGATVFTGSAPVGAGGDYALKFTLGAAAAAGTYVVTASGGAATGLLQHASFQVAAPGQSVLHVGAAESSYRTGARVTLVGSVAPPTAGPVHLTVLDADGHVVFSGAASQDLEGRFSAGFALSAAAAAGLYTIQATTATATGGIGGSGTFTVQAPGAAAVRVAAGEPSYHPGDAVTLRGAITPAAAASVALQVLAGTGSGATTVFAGQVEANAAGNFTETFTLAAAASPGPYTVYAAAGTALGAARGGTTFQVTSAGGGSPGSGGAGGTGGAGTGGGPGAGSGAAQGSGGTPASTPVGASGGTLASADGGFTLRVPAGAVTAGHTLSLSESCSPPAGLPAGLVAAGCAFTLTGGPLAEPQTARLAYEASVLGGLAAARLAVYERAPGGGWVFRPTSVQGAAATAEAKITVPGTVLVAAAVQQFPDLPAGFWARPAIDRLLAAGVVNGLPGGAFGPAQALTRAQFVKMLVLTLGLPPAAPAHGAFADVPASAWFAPFVATAAGAGLVQGVAPNRFDPGAAVTREEMAVLVARALHLTETAQPSFNDAAAIDAWAVPGVAATAAAGYMHGFPDGSFRPLVATTRAQAAEVLAAVLAHLAP